MPSFLKGAGLLAIALSLGATTAQADPEDTWNIVTGLSTMRDNNLFRRTSGQESSEQITGTSLGLRVNKPYSLQRFTVDAVFTDYRYNKNSYLDFVGKNLGAAWLWSITPRLHGNLSAKYDESLNSFVDYTGTTRNLRTTDTYRFDLEWEAWDRFRLVGGVNQVSLKNSQVFLAESDYKTDAVEYGVKYAMPSGSFLTLMARNAKGEYENRPINPFARIDSGFDQNDIEARFLWVATGKSRLNGKIGHIKREHDHYQSRDYSGVVGSLDYTWDIDGKLRLNAGYRQDLASYQNFESSYYKLNSFNVTPVWQIDGKVSLRARYNRETRDYEGALIALPENRKDTLTQALLAIDWAPLRTLTVSGTVQRDNRSSNRQNQDFSAQTLGVSANFVF